MMRVRFYGVRGSTPTSGSSTVRYGGHTSCVEVRPRGEPPIIIDAGTGLRRLGKPAWMLNYNDEPHWPVKLQNRIDFQTRMQQFFDYYLQGAPQPRWMERGVPPMEKGILQGLETGG